MANSKTTEHKEGKASIRVVYYTSKTLADGSHPFLICITKDRKRKYIATGLSLLPVFFDSSKSNYRDAIKKPTKELVKRVGETFDREKLIADLAEWEAKYKGAATTLAEADQQHDAPAVAKKAIEGRKATRRIKLLAYCEELAAGFVSKGKLGNASVYRDLLNQLAKFIGSEAGAPDVPLGRGEEQAKADWVAKYDIPFASVTVAFCDEWEEALRATEGKKKGEIIKESLLSLRFRTLRAVLNKAIGTGEMPASVYPFARTDGEPNKFQVGKFDLSTKKRAISRADVRKLEALEPATDRHRLAHDVFIFSFYCNGINHVDLGQLRWQDVSGPAGAQRLTYVRQKTKGKKKHKQGEEMALLAPAAAILDKYRPFTHAGPESYIFPILDSAKHQTAQQIKNRLHKSIGQINQDLTELGKMAGITTPLTTYVARHSFATALKNAGTATAVISQAMGHSSEAVTAIYLDSFGSDIMDSARAALL